MDNSNIKIYLIISGALVVLFILVLIIPFSKKVPDSLNPTPYLLPTPTLVKTNPFPSQQTNTNAPTPIITIKADFTGVAEEEIPKQIIDLAAQKKDLRQKTPLELSTFAINFDYNTDKFVVVLKDPKDQAQKEFESWRTANYPGLSTDQFLLK